MKRATRPGRIPAFVVLLVGLAAVGNLLGIILITVWLERGRAFWLVLWDLPGQFFGSIWLVGPVALAAGFVAHHAGGRNRILTAGIVLVCSLSLLPIGTLFLLSLVP